jgi:hypothetical protein
MRSKAVTPALTTVQRLLKSLRFAKRTASFSKPPRFTKSQIPALAGNFFATFVGAAQAATHRHHCRSLRSSYKTYPKQLVTTHFDQLTSFVTFNSVLSHELNRLTAHSKAVIRKTERNIAE